MNNMDERPKANTRSVLLLWFDVSAFDCESKRDREENNANEVDDNIYSLFILRVCTSVICNSRGIQDKVSTAH